MSQALAGSVYCNFKSGMAMNQAAIVENSGFQICPAIACVQPAVDRCELEGLKVGGALAL